MACIFDKEIFNQFRAKAITDLSQLEIGKNYWSNWSGPVGVLTAIVSDAKLHPHRKDQSDDPKWMIFNNDWSSYMSLSDNNIGTSYNPWMIFDNKETYKECCKQLEVKIVSDYDYDYADDYVDDYVDDYLDELEFDE
jgi:hypothetical protein